MTDDEIKAIVLRAIGAIAPEADLDQIDPAVDLREQLDIDSMDGLNIMIGIHEATGVDIPEADYPLSLACRGGLCSGFSLTSRSRVWVRCSAGIISSDRSPQGVGAMRVAT